jgi:hypothetical protein
MIHVRRGRDGMYLKTGAEYIQDMLDMHFELYIDGGKISGPEVVNHPQVRPMINVRRARRFLSCQKSFPSFTRP